MMRGNHHHCQAPNLHQIKNFTKIIKFPISNPNKILRCRVPKLNQMKH